MTATSKKWLDWIIFGKEFTPDRTDACQIVLDALDRAKIRYRLSEVDAGFEFQIENTRPVVCESKFQAIVRGYAAYQAAGCYVDTEFKNLIATSATPV